MGYRTSFRARKTGSRGCLLALFLGLVGGSVSGLGGIARATVACGSFDSTTMDLISVRKDGKSQPLPAQVKTYVVNEGPASVYDPDQGDFRMLYLELVR